MNNTGNFSPVAPASTESINNGVVYFGMISFICVGLLGQLGNLLVIVVILTTKPLNTPCFKLIAGGAFGSFMVGLHFFIRGILKLGELHDWFPLVRTGLECLLSTGVFGIFGIAYHALINCLVGVDRLISLLVPIKYRNFGNRYVIYTLSACALFVISQETTGFFVSPLYTKLVCRNFPEALHPLFIGTYAALNLFYCTTSVTVYSAMLVCFQYKKQKNNEGTIAYKTFMKQQSAAMPTVKLMTVLYFVCGIVPEILINVALKFDLNNQWVNNQLMVGDFLKNCSSMVEIVSLTIRSNKFRSGARAVLGMKEHLVNTISATPHH